MKHEFVNFKCLCFSYLSAANTISQFYTILSDILNTIMTIKHEPVDFKCLCFGGLNVFF